MQPFWREAAKMIKEYKNNKPIDEVVVDRDSLPNKLCEVFDSGVSGLKEIKILYIKYGLRNDLTEIEIFN